MVKFSSSVHYLSEEEMKSVIGGKVYYVDPELIKSGQFRYCMRCGYPFSYDELQPALSGNAITCPECGGKHQVE